MFLVAAHLVPVALGDLRRNRDQALFAWGQALATDGHRPNNTLGGIPTLALDYSPAWDANLYEWTTEAISRGYRGQLREEFDILTFVQDGLLTGLGGKPFGSAGLSINCSIVQRLD